MKLSNINKSVRRTDEITNNVYLDKERLVNVIFTLAYENKLILFGKNANNVFLKKPIELPIFFYSKEAAQKFIDHVKLNLEDFYLNYKSYVDSI